MSDGNFNRALLPHTPYQSGLRTGKTMARMHAVEAIHEIFYSHSFNLTEDEQKEFIKQFSDKLGKKLGL